MFSYAKIIKKAYWLALQNPILWLFGLFVVGGFNLNFFHFQNVQLDELPGRFSVPQIFSYFSIHPGILALASLVVLAVSIAAIVVTNWSRAMLVLSTQSLVEDKHANLPKQWAKSKKLIRPVIYVSLLTAIFMVAVAGGLLLPPLFIKDLHAQILFWLFAAILLMPLAFTISCINIFTTFYVVIFKKAPAEALQLGTDFFLVNWVKILGLTAVLGIIYLAFFVMGVSVIYLIRTLFYSLVQSYFGFNVFALSAIIIVRLVLFVGLWLFLGVLSAFFNVALLLLFLDLNTSTKFEEKQMELKPATANSLQ